MSAAKRVKFEDLVVGTGPVAEAGHVVTIRHDLFLKRGDCLQRGFECTVDLGKREIIAGLRYGIEGMRVGGQRRLRVGPHLAYGDHGTGIVPPKAVLVFVVDLLSSRPP